MCASVVVVCVCVCVCVRVRDCLSSTISRGTHSLPAEYPEAVILHVCLQRCGNGNWHFLSGLRLREGKLLNNLLFKCFTATRQSQSEVSG